MGSGGASTGVSNQRSRTSQYHARYETFLKPYSKDAIYKSDLLH